MARIVGRIALARIEPPDDRGDFAARIGVLLRPGQMVTRYGRDWHMATVSVDGRHLVGKIGYQRVGGTTDIWDPKATDFRTELAVDGSTSPFAVDTQRRIVSFQLRPGKIKRTSFTGALEQLINETASEPEVGDIPAWRVTPLVHEQTFEEFTERVDRVTGLRLVLQPPNPRFPGRETRQLIQGARSNLGAVVELRSDDPQGVNLDNDLVKQFIDHSYDHQYGYLVSHGEEDGRDIKFDSRRGEAPPEDQTTDVDPDRREVRWNPLKSATSIDVGEEDADVTGGQDPTGDDG